MCMQEGKLRKAAETKAGIRSTFELATKTGADDKLDKLISSGIRDSLTMPTIEKVVEKGKELRGRGRFKGKQKALPEEEVLRKLQALLDPGSRNINPLLDLSGEWSTRHSCCRLTAVGSLFCGPFLPSLRHPK